MDRWIWDNLRPFHPAGMAGAKGGVSIEGRRVVLRNPSTGEIDAEAALPGGVGMADLYRGEIFRLFPGETWYTALPWIGEVEVRLVRLERDRLVDGVLAFQRAGLPPGKPQTWDAAVRYGDCGPAWDIRAPLPPDHPFPGDVAFRVQIAWALHRALGGGVPACGVPGDVFSAEVGNLFAGGGAFRQLPFSVDGVGDNPALYLLRAYAWAWRGA
jgi:hypothetical protein